MSNKIKNNVKYRQILDTAKDLFWRFGIRRVSIEEICQSSGVSKMTFYKYFSNKNDLAVTILDTITEEGMQKYRDIVSKDIPYPQKVREMIGLKFEQTREMSSEFFNDIYQYAAPEIRQHMAKIVETNLQLILRDLTEAQKRGDIRGDIKPAFILYFLNHLMEMVEDERLQGLYDNPQELVMEMTQFLFYGILERG